MKQSRSCSRHIAHFVLLSWLVGAACTGNANVWSKSETGKPSSVSSTTPGPVGSVSPSDFEALSPTQYGTKVKALLTGLPLTADEYTALSKSADALDGMVDTWMATPQWQKIMLDYFRKVFQTGTNNFFDYANLYVRIYQINQDWNWFGWHTWYDIISSMQDMFPHTAVALVNENAPFTQVLTTTRYMMNTPMMAMSAYLDAIPQDDNAADELSGYWMSRVVPSTGYTRESTRVIDYSASMNPNSPDFMTWFDPAYEPNNTYDADWCHEPFTVSPNGATTAGYNMGSTYASQITMIHLFGGRRGCTPWQLPGASQGRSGVFTDADWSTWKWVTTRHPNAGENPTVFFNVPQMRAGNELVLNGDQAGFITTPGFLENWMTNASNADRVLVNQTLIIGLDFTFAPQNSAPSATTGDPNQHAVPGTVCYSCHASLDPAVALFRESYSLSHRWQASLPSSVPATGAVNIPGAPVTTGRGVTTLASALAAHPLFASGWVQKMCRFANASACVETDPEFQRIVSLFVSSNYNFSAMVKALMTSPLVTSASYTPSAASASAQITQVSIARRDQFCAALEARLKWPDVCQLRVHGMYGSADADGDAYGSNVRALGQTVADAVFTRGQIAPAMPTSPDLFYVLSSDNLCLLLSQQVVDGTPGTASGTSYPAASVWNSGDPNKAIADFVQVVMGVPQPDPRTPSLEAILQQHFANAVAAKATASDALRSTFISACTAGTSLARGL